MRLGQRWMCGQNDWNEAKMSILDEVADGLAKRAIKEINRSGDENIEARIAHVQDFIGFDVARPAAPFVYTLF